MSAELSKRLYFIVQINHKTLGWRDWAPEGEVKGFGFEMDARDEAAKARGLYFVRDVRVVRVTETRDIVSA